MHLNNFGIVSQLSDLQAVEQVPGGNFFLFSRTVYPEVVAYAYEVSDIIAVEVVQPMLANELPIGYQTIYTVTSKAVDKVPYQRDAFAGIGVTPFVEHLEHYWKGNGFIADSKHKYIDVLISHFPIGSIHGEYKVVLDGKQAKYELGDPDHG